MWVAEFLVTLRDFRPFPSNVAFMFEFVTVTFSSGHTHLVLSRLLLPPCSLSVLSNYLFT